MHGEWICEQRSPFARKPLQYIISADNEPLSLCAIQIHRRYCRPGRRSRFTNNNNEQQKMTFFAGPTATRVRPQMLREEISA